MKFSEIELKEALQKSIERKGFDEMTEIQAEAIQEALNGRDVLGQAQTGTGKTAAFAVPVLNKIDPEEKSLQALVLVPTRELAVQVNKEFQSLGKDLKIKSLDVYGGVPIDRQMKALREHPQIVVGTPGRCIDLINRKKLKVHDLKFFVLDEVDEMLNMGFIDDVEYISEKMPKQKQTLLFSATMPDKIKKIVNNYLNDPIHIKVKSKSITAKRVEQFYMLVKNNEKLACLQNIINLNLEDKIIIFTQTKRSADQVTEFLQANKLNVGKIHGDLAQQNRIDIVQKFSKNQLDLLVATDVMARGIDIDNVDVVINYELPQDIEYYIHRIGRTARGIDAKGRAITLVSPNVYDREFRFYEKELNVTITKLEQPKAKDIADIFMKKIEHQLKESTTTEKVFSEFAEKLLELEDLNMEDLISKLLKKGYPELDVKEVKPARASQNGRSGNGRSGNGRSGNGRSGNGRSGNGRSGNGRSGNGRSGNGRSQNGRSQNGRSQNGKPGNGRSGDWKK